MVLEPAGAGEAVLHDLGSLRTVIVGGVITMKNLNLGWDHNKLGWVKNVGDKSTKGQ